MATYVFSLDSRDEEKLELSWDGIDYQDRPIHIMLGGNEIGVIPDKKALREGQVFSLPDGSAIHIQQIKQKGLQIFHSGKQLSIISPTQRARSDVATYRLATSVIDCIGWYTMLLGVVVLITGAFSAVGTFALYWIITGIVFLVLGYFARQAYILSLIIALIYYALDTASLIILLAQGSYLMIAGIVLHLCLMVPLYRGIAPLRRLMEEKV